MERCKAASASLVLIGMLLLLCGKPVSSQTQYVVTVPEEETVMESDTDVMVCLSISPALTGIDTVTIDAATMDGTAVEPEDYTTTTDSLIFTSTASTPCITVPIAEDTIVEGDQSFTVNFVLDNDTTVLVGTDDTVMLSRDSSTVVIQDNDVITVSFVEAAYTVTEGETVMVCVQLDSGSVQTDVTVGISRTAGTALASDYTGVMDVTFPAGQSGNQCLTITAVDDDDLEADIETLVLTLEASAQVTVGTTGTTTVTITDDDMITVSIMGAPNVSVMESDGMLQVCVTLSEAAVRNVTVNLQTSDDSATAPDDYTALNEDLTIPAGDTMGCVDVTIIEDDAVEGNQTFTVTLTAPADDVTPTNNVLTVTIQADATDMVTVSVPETATATAEGAEEMVEVCVNVAGTLERDLVVSVMTQDGTAVAGEDYTTLMMDLTFSSAGQMCVNIMVTNDMNLEEAETFLVMISTEDTSASVTNAQTQIMIPAGGGVTLGFVDAALSVNESESVSVCVMVTAGGLGRDVELDVASTPVSSAVVPTPLMFSSGETQACFMVNAPSDDILEDDEVLTLTLSTGVSGVTLDPNTIEVTVVDMTVVTIGFTMAEYSIAEGATDMTVCIQLVAPGVLQRETVVTVTTMDGTAMAPEDYTAVSEMLSFDSATDMRCVEINTTGNEVLEDVRVFTVQLSTGEPMRVTLDPSTAEVTITEDDGIVITVQEEVSVVEGEVARILLNITSGVLGRNVSISATSVDLTGDGAATEGVDYEAVDGVLTFSPSVTMETLEIMTFNDNLTSEESEMFTVEFVNGVSTDDGLVTLMPDISTITIIDAPFIEEQPMNQFVLLGDDAVFSISAMGFDISFQWVFEGVELVNSERVQGANDSTLTIMNVTTADFGGYLCQVSSVVSSINSSMANLTQLMAPEIEDISDNTGVLLEDDITLNCTVRSDGGLDTLNVSWTTNILGVVLPQPELTVLSDTMVVSSLTLLSVNNTASGTYACRATNRATTTTQEVTISVVTINGVENQTVTVGNDITLFCDAEADETLTYAWEQVLGSVSPSNPFNDNELLSRITGEDTNTLSISDVAFIDAMDYRCNVSVFGELVGFAIGFLITRRAELVAGPEGVSLAQGERLELNCTGRNNSDAPNPLTFMWWRASTLVPESAVITEIVLDNLTVTSQLVIPSILREEAGLYVCEVHNRQFLDGIQSEPADVVVRFPPVVTLRQENEDPMPTFSVPIGGNETVECSVEAVPAPDVIEIVRIDANGSRTVEARDEISPDDNRQVYTLERTVFPTSLEETDIVYQCVANSTEGVGVANISLIVQAVPEMINHTQVQEDLINLVQTRLTWPVPRDNNAPITGYSITFCVTVPDTVDCLVDSAMIVSLDTTTVLRGMTSGDINAPVNSRIRVEIVAINAVGMGPAPDVPFFFNTFTPEQAEAVNEGTVVVTSDTALVTWELPPSATRGSGVVLDQFLVTVSAVGGAELPDEFNVTMGASGGTTFGITLTDLSPPGGMYSVEIVTQYSVPDLETAAVMFRFSLLGAAVPVPPLVDAPGLPAGSTANSVSLSWTLPDDNEFITNIVISVISTSLLGGPSPNRGRRQSNDLPLLPPTATGTVVPVPPFSTNEVMVDALLMPPGAAEPLRTPLIDPVSIDSQQGVSGPPVITAANPVNFNKIDLTWSTPAEPNGEILDYQIIFGIRGEGGSNMVRTITPVNSYQLSDLEPNSMYDIRVLAFTNGGLITGQQSDPFSTTTTFGVAPSTVMHFIKPGVNGVFTLVFTLNEEYGPLSYFQVVVTTSNTIDTSTIDTAVRSPDYYVAYQVDFARAPPTYDLGTGTSETDRSIVFNNAELRGNTDYYVFIRAFSSIDETVSGDGPFSLVIRFTPSLNTVAIIVPIAAVALILLIVLVVLLLVAYLTMSNSARKRGYTPRNGLLEDGKRRNRGGAALELRRTRLFSPVLNVGSPDVFTSAGQPTTLICEASGTPAPEVTWTHNDEPLDKERFIQLADGSLFINDTDLQDEGTYVVRASNTAGEAEAAVRVTVLRPIPPDSDIDHAPIKVGEFSQKIALVRAEDDEGLEDEYAEVELDWTFTSYAAKLNINKNKNRYINIIPYDHSRVVLSLQDNTPGSDYINASFVDAYQRPNGYIASQGPIPSTFPDFWRMVWELDSPTIVMVTNLKEEDKVKCHQYWPSYGTTTYGNIQVTLKEVENLAEYSIRTFNVSPLAGQSRVPMPVREVRQFHFLVWPDHGVPQYATNLLSFRKRVLKYHPEKRGPMVVHCSAGVGRTGTFITIDYMLKQIEAEGSIDIFNFVRHMRYRRNYMVQTSPQYVFIHDALLESIMCGDNSIKAPEMRTKVKEMQEVIQETGLSKFQTQFNTLCSASPPDDDFDCSIAQLPDNMSKNRFKEHLPANDYRVVLSTDGDQSDYICASYVDNYRERNAFIVTQAPLADTVSDFWRMMWETKSAAIVMLTELQEEDQEMSVKYWPSGVGDPSVYGGYQVELSEEEKDRGSYITRRFKLSMLDKPQESRMVSQFHFTKWTKTTPPTDCRPIIDLIDELQRVQRKSGNMPITVHCDDGVGRTGAFCALYSVLERVKTEQIVDVFQAVKTLRIQRAGLLATIEQYEFVHRAVIEFLDTFSDYQNFK